MDAGHWLLVVALFGSWAVAYYRVRRRPEDRPGVTVEEWRQRLARRRREDEP